jgi:uncharacterized repeat protein (TIGR01451 family)
MPRWHRITPSAVIGPFLLLTIFLTAGFAVARLGPEAGEGHAAIDQPQEGWSRVNYAHDRVGANYPVGHSFWITLTDSGGAIKGQGVADTAADGGWGGDGFDAAEWVSETPDIRPGDFVYLAADDGYTNTVEVGHISGTVDVQADAVTGITLVPSLGITITLPIECHPWGAWQAGNEGAPIKYSWATPDGSVPFNCQWDPGTEWDVQPGQDVAVMYLDPSGDGVIDVYREAAPYLRIHKQANGAPGQDGHLRFQIGYSNAGDGIAENVVISDTLQGGLEYLSDTSGFPHTGSGSGPIAWDLGALEPESEGGFDLFAEVTALASSTVTNTVWIATSSPGDQGESGEKTSSWSGHVASNDTHLSVGKWARTPDPAPGHDLVFVVNVCNDGTTDSTEVTLSDTLHPDLELVDWAPQHPGWYMIYTDTHRLEAALPSLSAGTCSAVHMRAHLAAAVGPGAYLTNTAVIAASNDLESEDNEAVWEGWVGEPHTNLAIRKRFGSGSLVPGGWIRYAIGYENTGNLPVGSVLITDTLPVGTTFFSAWHHDPAGGYEFPPLAVTDEVVVWQLEELENGSGGEFEIVLAIDAAYDPDVLLVNTAEISDLPGENTYDDNFSLHQEAVRPSGANLRVQKSYAWHGDWQLEYQVRFDNLGDALIAGVAITDTLPLLTAWDEWWDMDFDSDRLVSFDASVGILAWQFSELFPGESGTLFFNANLDAPGVPLRWYTNTVQITTPITDTNPADNADESVAFSGGELRSVELWLERLANSSMWGEAVPSAVVTVTTPITQVTSWADPGCGGCWGLESVGPLQPGDVVEVTAGAGLLPVVITIPDPFDATVDTGGDEVVGQIGGWQERTVEIHGNWPQGYREVVSEPDGSYLVPYPDIPPGGHGFVRIIDAVSYAEVVFHRPFWALDLILEIDYGHDWVEGNYEPGHSVWITATESDAATVKGTAELSTGILPFRESSGFSTRQEGWQGEVPGLQPGDWIHSTADNGYGSSTQLGDIDFRVDYGTDVVTGTLSAPWLIDAVPLRCAIQEQPDSPGIDLEVDPNGGAFDCNFGTAGWDLVGGQSVNVMYWEPDADRILNSFDWPLMVASIGPDSGGDRRVWGTDAGPGATVAITVTTELGAFVDAAQVTADARGNFDTGLELAEGSLALWNRVFVDFGDGITDTLTVYPLSGTADTASDVITVTAAGPEWFAVDLDYCSPQVCGWIELGEIGPTGVVTVDLAAERGVDLKGGAAFTAHLHVWNNQQVEYAWSEAAPSWSKSINGQPWSPDIEVIAETADTLQIVDTFTAAEGTITQAVVLTQEWDPVHLALVDTMVTAGEVLTSTGGIEWSVDATNNGVTLTTFLSVQPSTWTETLLVESEGLRSRNVPVHKLAPELFLGSIYADVVEPGQVASFELQYGNNGGYENSVGIRAEFPPEAPYVSATPPPDRVDPGGSWAEWDLGDLANGSIGTIGVQVAIGIDLPGGAEIVIPAAIFNHVGQTADETQIVYRTLAFPGIAVQKLTNGQDADTPPGPTIPTGASVTWSYRITNTGNVTLDPVRLIDDREGQVPCEPGALAPGQASQCQLERTAIAGLYANVATAIGTPPDGLEDVGAEDPSHYFGAAPELELRKRTNDLYAPELPGPYILVGEPVTWSYTVTNTGNITLTQVTLIDDPAGEVDCPLETLASGERMQCELIGIAALGPYTNTAIVRGTPPGGLADVLAEDSSHYFGVDLIFSDDFESGDTSNWDEKVPP